MISKILKYLLLLLLALLLLVLLTFSYVIYTEHGSRLAIDFALKRAAIDASYANINGTLAKGLKLSKVQYQDESVTIHIKDIDYQANWSIFNRFVDVSEMQISGVDLWLKQQEQVSDDYKPFAGFEWPFALDVKSLMIKDLGIHNQESIQHMQNIHVITSASGHKTEIKALNLQTAELSLQSSGVIDSKDGLKYQFSPTIELNNAEWQTNTSGEINGDLQSLHINQKLAIKHPQIIGKWSIRGSIESLTTTPVLNVSFNSPQLQISLDDQLIDLRESEGQLTGELNGLKLSLESTLTAADLPPAQLLISGQGDLQQFQFKQVQLETEEGTLAFTGLVDWQEQLKLNGQIQLTSFNPAQVLPEWPGTLNGTAAIDLQNTSKGMFIDSKNNDIQGTLKGQPFKFKGDLVYKGQQISAEQLTVSLGENNILANGIISDNQVAMDLSLDWPELRLLDAELSGQLTGTLSISGNHKTPHFEASLQAQNIRFKNHQAEQILLNSQGIWQQDIQSEITSKNLLLSDRLIDDITIKQTGWLDQHQIDISATHDELQQSISLNGSYELDQHHWQGTLQQHQLTLYSGKTISLTKPVGVQWMDTVEIEPACWQGEAQGKLCIELSRTNQQLLAEISVDALNLTPFQMWLPNGLQLMGHANGAAYILRQNDDLKIESNLVIEDGSLIIKQHSKPAHEVAITELKLLANASQDGSNVQLNLSTAEGDELSSQANINIDTNQHWHVDGALNGIIKNTAAITLLSNEISEISGSFALEGQIQGLLKKPRLQLNFSQSTGHVRLSRLGTVIEQLKVQVATEASSLPSYQIDISGQNLASVNQGTFESSGVLTLVDGLNEKPEWSYQGQLSGQNFMIFNIPELKLHVSPDLEIIANQNAMSVQGNLNFDEGRVVVEQLPPETVSNSEDLVNHSKADEPKATNYPITFDINANILDHLELDVIGLNASLLGSMRLQQAQNQGISAIGTLNLEDGKYEVYGQKLDISKGEMTFSGPLENPKLNVKASRKSLDGTVIAGVQLGGTVNNLQSELFSEPNLTDIEILSYIMTGNGINQAGSINGDQLKQTAILLGLNQGAPVFRQIQNTFGIDVLTIKEAADTEDTVIEAGKKINDKLYVSYNHGIFNRLGFWVLKYKLNEFLNLQTTQGEDQSIELVYTRKAKNRKVKTVDD